MSASIPSSVKVAKIARRSYENYAVYRDSQGVEAVAPTAHCIAQFYFALAAESKLNE